MLRLEASCKELPPLLTNLITIIHLWCPSQQTASVCGLAPLHVCPAVPLHPSPPEAQRFRLCHVNRTSMWTPWQRVFLFRRGNWPYWPRSLNVVKAAYLRGCKIVSCSCADKGENQSGWCADVSKCWGVIFLHVGSCCRDNSQRFYGMGGTLVSKWCVKRTVLIKASSK